MLFLLFALSSSSAALIDGNVSPEAKFSWYHPEAPATSWAFRILERHSELIDLSVNLHSARSDIFKYFQYFKCSLS
jgi:hypothetical protein